MIIRIIQLLTNVLLLNAAFVLSYFLRYVGEIPGIAYAPYKENFAFLTCLYLLCLTFTGTFKRRFCSAWYLFKSLVVGLFLGMLFAITFVYAFRLQWSKFPTSIFMIHFPISLLFMFLSNAMILRFAGSIRRKIVVLGENNDLEIPGQGPYVEKTHIDNIEELLHYKDIDEVLICSHIRNVSQMNLLIFLLVRLKVNVVFSPAIYAKLMSESMMDENSHKYLTTSIGYKSDSEEFFLRTLDLLGSMMLLLFLSPLFVLVAVAVKATSAGTVFYKQIRIGKDGEPFVLYKFRTMVDGAEKNTGPILASENDPRVTRIGRIMRATRVDEFPQLLNVIKGDMSLVGPRPERPHFVKRHKALREMRLAVKPGLTGLAQIRNIYGLRPEHKIKYDYLYIQKRSVPLNLYILMKTVPVVFSKKGL